MPGLVPGISVVEAFAPASPDLFRCYTSFAAQRRGGPGWARPWQWGVNDESDKT